jgi:hypothetical protein
MDRIVRAEAAAMRVTLASLLAEIDTAPAVRAIADKAASE